MKMSPMGRSSKLGNNVFKVFPRNVLPSLHNKTYFKACETILLGQNFNDCSLNFQQNELQHQIKQVSLNLKKLNPESKTFQQLNEIRYKKIKE